MADRRPVEFLHQNHSADRAESVQLRLLIVPTYHQCTSHHHQDTALLVRWLRVSRVNSVLHLCKRQVLAILISRHVMSPYRPQTAPLTVSFSRMCCVPWNGSFSKLSMEPFLWYLALAFVRSLARLSWRYLRREQPAVLGPGRRFCSRSQQIVLSCVRNCLEA